MFLYCVFVYKLFSGFFTEFLKRIYLRRTWWHCTLRTNPWAPKVLVKKLFFQFSLLEIGQGSPPWSWTTAGSWKKWWEKSKAVQSSWKRGQFNKDFDPNGWVVGQDFLDGNGWKTLYTGAKKCVWLVSVTRFSYQTEDIFPISGGNFDPLTPCQPHPPRISVLSIEKAKPELEELRELTTPHLLSGHCHEILRRHPVIEIFAAS